MTKLDMSWGNPEFLYPIWNHVECTDELDIRPGNYSNVAKMSLKNEILEFHDRVHSLNDEFEVVVANGATQALSAALYAFSKMNPKWSEDRRPVLKATVPFYSRFPVLADLAGYDFYDIGDVEVVTSPNNPCGTMMKTRRKHNVVYDYSYNWPQYTPVMEALDKDVMVFSLAKATGHADLRVGWALVKKEWKHSAEFVRLMEEYIEFSTMGVSKQAQHAAFTILDTIHPYHESFFDGASAKLNARWELVKKAKLPFEVLNQNGMFLWCKGELPSGLIGLSGEHFGASNDHFRLNLGCSDATFAAFLEKYAKQK
jgi:aspartate/methionine/tyrosine aminotransferase